MKTENIIKHVSHCYTLFIFWVTPQCYFNTVSPNERIIYYLNELNIFISPVYLKTGTNIKEWDSTKRNLQYHRIINKKSSKIVQHSQRVSNPQSTWGLARLAGWSLNTRQLWVRYSLRFFFHLCTRFHKFSTKI